MLYKVIIFCIDLQHKIELSYKTNQKHLLIWKEN